MAVRRPNDSSWAVCLAWGLSEACADHRQSHGRGLGGFWPTHRVRALPSPAPRPCPSSFSAHSRRCPKPSVPSTIHPRSSRGSLSSVAAGTAAPGRRTSTAATRPSSPSPPSSTTDATAGATGMTYASATTPPFLTVIQAVWWLGSACVLADSRCRAVFRSNATGRALAASSTTGGSTARRSSLSPAPATGTTWICSLSETRA